MLGAPLISFQSFYLPGSVDAKDKQMEQWNVMPPLLYLWSHPDWSAKHRKIAESHDHISKQQEAVEGHSESMIPDHLMADHDGFGYIPNHAMADRGDYGDIPEHAMDDPGDYGNMNVPDHATDDHDNFLLTEDPVETENFKGYAAGDVGTGHKERFPLTSSDRGSHESHVRGKKPSIEKSKKRSRGSKKNKRRTSGEKSTHSKQDGGRRPLVGEIPNGRPPYADVGVNSYQHFESSISNSRAQFGTAYDDDLYRKYGIDGDEHHSRLPSRSVADYGVRNLEGQQFMGHMRDSADSFNSRPLEMEDMLRRDSGIRSVRLYGQQEPEVQGSYYPGGQDPRYGQIGSRTPFSSTYGLPGPISEPSYRLNPPGAQWYIPQSDPLHHSRMSALGSEPPPMFGGDNMIDPRAPPHGHPGGHLGFASGPYQPYSHHNSAGWLND